MLALLVVVLAAALVYVLVKRPVRVERPEADRPNRDPVHSDDETSRRLPPPDKKAIEARAGEIYALLQKCAVSGDIEPARGCLAQPLYDEMRAQFAALKRQGRSEHIENLTLLDAAAEAPGAAQAEYSAIVTLRARLIEYTLDAAGRIVDGSKTALSLMTYSWLMSGPCISADAPDKAMERPDANEWVLSAVLGVAQRTEGEN